MNQPYISDAFRWIELSGKDRLKLTGTFTADDLKKLAEWLENPNRPTDSNNIIDVKLSDTIP